MAISCHCSSSQQIQVKIPSQKIQISILWRKLSIHCFPDVSCQGRRLYIWKCSACRGVCDLRSVFFKTPHTHRASGFWESLSFFENKLTSKLHVHLLHGPTELTCSCFPLVLMTSFIDILVFPLFRSIHPSFQQSACLSLHLSIRPSIHPSGRPASGIWKVCRLKVPKFAQFDFAEFIFGQFGSVQFTADHSPAVYLWTAKFA